MPHKKGDRVRHPRCEDWGLGEVLEDSRGHQTRVFFVNAGEKTISDQYVELILVTGDEAESRLLDNLQLSEKPGMKYKSLPDSIEYFLEQYPNGFYGDRYLSEERDYKTKAQQLAHELLGKEALAHLLTNNQNEEICTLAQKVMNATNLVFPNEKMAFKDGLKDAATQRDYAEALYALLYGEVDMKERFEQHARTLTRMDADKWPVATYFPFIVLTETNMFVKPVMTQNAANICGYNIDYRSQLNWSTYHQVLGFAGYLKEKLVELRPRDMIDVQSFMWCIAPG